MTTEANNPPRVSKRRVGVVQSSLNWWTGGCLKGDRNNGAVLAKTKTDGTGARPERNKNTPAPAPLLP